MACDCIKKRWEQFHAYKWSVSLSAVIILGWWFLGKNSQIISAIAGLMFGAPISLFLKSFNRPILEIDSVEFDELILSTEGVSNPEYVYYKVNKVVVRNVGRSVAKNCKGYFILDENTCKIKTRICWDVSTERPNATINVNDYERLNVCAFYIEGDTRNIIKKLPDDKPPSKIIIPHELDWKVYYKYNTCLRPWQTCRSVEFLKKGHFRICVTAENAKPVEVLMEVDEYDKEIKIIK